MNTSRKSLILEANKKALQVRQKAGLRLSDPVAIYDLAENLGLEVRFTNQIPNFEGMYIQRPTPHILVSSLRPRGRQAFTCAHELGHHIYGHGLHISELVTEQDLFKWNQNKANEFSVNQFAAFLLMPSTTVHHAFTIRGWKPNECTPLQVYTVAGWLGVGYTTLIYQMGGNLQLLDDSQVTSLLKASPKSIRSQFQGNEAADQLVLVDQHWKRRAIDLQLGDLVLLPMDAITDGKGQLQVVRQDSQGILCRAVKPGIGQVVVHHEDWASFVRVSPKDFVGRSIFRHFEEYEDE